MLLASFSPFDLSGTAVWFWLTLLIGLVWLRRHGQLNWARREPVLSAADAERGVAGPCLSVLVAGKDEEANIEACLTGLLRQDYPGFEVIAVNDRSTDRTGVILDALAAREPRLKVVHVRDLPEGWAGKNHALHLGVQRADGRWLCFTDADCRFHDARLLAAAVRVAERDGIDFLSVLPTLEAHTFWERVVQPPAGAIMLFWFPPQKVNDPRSTRAYANGAFMLMRREAYERLGGHAAVRMALNEDMHFARRAKQLGLRLRVIRSAGMYSVRMYVGLRQIWAGWSRIFYGCFGTWPRLTASAIFLLVFSLSPPSTLLCSPWLGSSGVALACAGAFTVLAQQTVLWRYYRLSGMPGRWALTYPLGAGLCVAMLGNALTRAAGRQTRWRGTAYTGGA
ncbi:MAG: glycosyltransferase family 2 protein [Planctomycetota bacterium]